MHLLSGSLPLFALLAVGWCKVLTDEECRKPPENWPEKPPACCSELPYPTEEMKQIFGKCISSLQEGGTPAPPEKKGDDPRLCVEECVYKDLGFIRDGKTLSNDAVTSRTGKQVASAWTTIMQNAAKACANVTAYEGPNPPTCSTLAHEHTHCVTRLLFLNCPKALWKNTNECKLVKNRMLECPGIPPPPPPAPEAPKKQ